MAFFKENPNCRGRIHGSAILLVLHSMQETLSSSICLVCKSYWPSSAAVLCHKKCHWKTKLVIECEGSEIKLESEGEGSKIELKSESESESESERETNKQEKEEDNMPTFANIFDILASPFMELE